MNTLASCIGGVIGAVIGIALLTGCLALFLNVIGGFAISFWGLVGLACVVGFNNLGRKIQIRDVIQEAYDNALKS